MLDDAADVASVATVAKPGPRSPDKAALAYLEASGARAISITTGCAHTVINVGYKADAVAAYWLPADKARAVAARARSIAGDADDVATVVAALKEAALQCRATLTEHDTAMVRAHAMAERLDEFMSSMRGTGVLREFNHTYKARRQAAFARGEQFLKYKVALARLRSAMVPVLMNDGQPVLGASLFAQVFDK
jgi:hypothetical protein